MRKPKLPYIQRMKSGDRERKYYRRGSIRVRLPDLPEGHPKFLDAYNEAAASAPSDGWMKQYRRMTAVKTKDGTRYFIRRSDGVLVQVPQTRFESMRDLRAFYDAVVKGTITTEISERINMAALRDGLRRARNRAASKAVPFDLSLYDLEVMYRDQGGRCAISGLPFRAASGHRVNSYQPSIDRIVPSAGYVKGNVRLTLHIVNIGMSDIGADEYIEVCRAVHRQNVNSVSPSIPSVSPEKQG